MLRRALVATAIAGSTVSATYAAEEFTTKNNLNHRPVRQIAAELDVTPQQFADCFSLVEPAKDFKPSKARERANKAKLLPCLQKANSRLSNDRLDHVMDKYRGIHVN